MGKQLTPLRKIKRLEIFYATTIGVLMVMVIGAPFLVRQWITMTNHLLSEQEILEALLIAVLLSLAYALSRIYKRQLSALQEEIQRLAMNNTTMQCRLTDAFKYIGQVNVQLQEIRSAFSLLNRLPQSRKEFKTLLRVFAKKALTIANTDWAAVRIIERTSLRTLIEHLEARRSWSDLHPHIGNRAIIEGEAVAGRAIIRCENENLDIAVVCIFPRDELSWEEKVLLESIAGEIELLFFTFTASQLNRIDRTTDHLIQPIERMGLSRNGERDATVLCASRCDPADTLHGALHEYSRSDQAVVVMQDGGD